MNIVINRQEAMDNFKCGVGRRRLRKVSVMNVITTYLFTRRLMSFIFLICVSVFYWTEKIFVTFSKLVSFINPNLISKFHFTNSFPFLFLASEPDPQNCDWNSLGSHKNCDEFSSVITKEKPEKMQFIDQMKCSPPKSIL